MTYSLILTSGIIGISMCLTGFKINKYGRDSISEWWYCFYMMIGIPILMATLIPQFMLKSITLILAGIFPFTVFTVLIESSVGFVYNKLENKSGGPAGRISKGYQDPDHLLTLNQKVNKGSFHIFIAVYLDNEIDIIESTLESYTKLEYGKGKKNDKITVEIIYNTSVNVSTETIATMLYIKNKWHNKTIGSCLFKIVHNTKSSSKAENINFGLETLISDTLNTKDDNFDLPDYIGVFDADHQIDSMAVMHASQLFREGSDIIQGHCTVRNYADSLITSIVAIEFEDLYNLGQEGRCHLYDLALFSGSVGFWRSSILMNIKFDGSIMTEDIDSSFRATETSANVTYCHSIKSTELATETFKSLLNQRQRWGQGWLQTSKKHLYNAIYSSKAINYKIGVILLLFWCEIYPYFTFTPIIFLIIAYIRNINLFTSFNFIIFLYCPLFMNLLRMTMLALVADGPITMNKRWSTYFLFYYNISLMYQGLLNIIKVSSHWREIIKKKEWIVTSRGSFTTSVSACLLAK